MVVKKNFKLIHNITYDIFSIKSVYTYYLGDNSLNNFYLSITSITKNGSKFSFPCIAIFLILKKVFCE